ncbi:hypothetical protein VC83_00384 [Pseudogymnoascus destructans]|uniref:Uncharacterized protein n=2 Tax=Pseudogymnoascus destructans TaxID=655981 RepID=L8FSB8_PSED2|nr:uncharacterized protein VC83_00384 [Pseudogymnoascus destructans]ELR03464.1 hypothetical protein GMDG_06197 [Pseudogymnoascus destructans 20631-21]OAF62861.1 hypothetical protein VC83_00384 [Pseudogymnoascus destructans]
MCLILSTSHLCHHKTLTPATRPCQHFLNNYASQRWRSQLECPYKRFTYKRDGKLCPGCTTEFGHPYGDQSEEGEQLERVRRERMSTRETVRRESMRRECVRRERVRIPERGGTFRRALERLARWFLR